MKYSNPIFAVTTPHARLTLFELSKIQLPRFYGTKRSRAKAVSTIKPRIIKDAVAFEKIEYVDRDRECTKAKDYEST
jgi:hypothetical protein